MITSSATLLVNNPGETPLTREQVWAGLLAKAADAVPYVPSITECVVVERSADGLVREAVINGERIREAVTFEPKTRVSFVRDDAEVRWLIRNDIGEDASGALTLTFSAEISVPGDPAAERALGEGMKTGYPAAMANTLAVMRAKA